MKFYSSLLGCGVAMLMWLCSTQIQSQVRSVYDQMDLSDVSSKFFYPQTFAQRHIPDPTLENDFIEMDESASVFAAFDKACLEESSYINDFATFRNQMRDHAESMGCRALAILDISYHDFKPYALDSNLIYLQDQKFYDIPNRPQSPYEKKETMVLWIDHSSCESGQYQYLLCSSSYISNRGMTPTSIEMDFDDGLGYRSVYFDQPITVNYPDDSEERSIRCKVNYSDSTVHHAGVHKSGGVSFNVCESSTFPFPHAPLWNVDSGTDWGISVDYYGEIISGNAYTLHSDDGVFDKPFIFVEGVDFGVDEDGYAIQTYYSHGTFGWCEFSSGYHDPNPYDDEVYAYDDIQNLPMALHELRENGYDIILLDFKDGATDIEKNGMLLRKLITLCNDYKTGYESLVIAGASMGGQVSRYALRTMELDGIDHCTRLWISYDSPHTGANIPLGLQRVIKFLANNGIDDAITFKEKYLLRPAARQMLNQQEFSEITMRNDYYTLMDNLGYPQNCRSIAFTNGSLDGVGLEYSLDRMLDWNCQIFGLSPVKFFIFPNSGDPGHDLSNSWNNVHCIFRMPIAGFQQLGNEYYPFLGALPLFAVDFIDFEQETFYTPTNTENVDYAPGGYRNSMLSFVKSINESLSSNNASAVCGSIEQTNYNKYHSFVSTKSSLGLPVENVYESIEDLLGAGAITCPFDAYYAPTQGNEAHVEITELNVQRILDEIFAYERSGIADDLHGGMQNNGVFNYGKQPFVELHDLHIHDGGKLVVNGNFNTHFGELNDTPTTEGVYEIGTLECSPAIIRVDEFGAIEIGDAVNSSYAGRVVIRRDSKLIVGENGSLRVFEGSTLVIEEGGELVLEPGSFVNVNNARIELKPGSKMTCTGEQSGQVIHVLQLAGSNACLSIENGQLIIESNVTFTLDNTVYETGYIEILPGSENTLHTFVASEFKMTGHGTDDLILKINDFAHLQNANFGMGSIFFENCKVDLSGYGAIWTDLYVSANNTLFTSTTNNQYSGGDILIWSGAGMFSSCIWDRVKLKGHAAKLVAQDCAFSGSTAGMDLFMGGYQVFRSTFDNASLFSKALQFASVVEQTEFADRVDAMLYDKSLVEIEVRKCGFSGASDEAIHKVGGKLTISCSSFADIHGVKIEEGELNMSSGDRGGYNVFNQADPCIILDNAASVNLNEGYNDFSGFLYHCIVGTINLPCGGNFECYPIVPAKGNFWGLQSGSNSGPMPNELVQPTEEFFDIHTSLIIPCAGYESVNSCNVVFVDTAPENVKSCPDKFALHVKSAVNNSDGEKTETTNAVAKSNIIETENNPELNTVTFQNIALDSALVYAATFMENYDSTANDETCVNLMHEILMTDLDFNNSRIRSKMNWGRMIMKSVLENMFLDQELVSQNNQTSFEPLVQKYVDVLNRMTDTDLTDSTYRSQFYLELDKGQFFRTIGKPEVALEVFSHLGDCQLDSLEQTLLNEWRAQVELEMLLNHQIFVEGVAPDSLHAEIDSVDYSTPMAVEVSNHYFGLWIDSPSNITFVACGDDPVYRFADVGHNMFGVFPNPSHDMIAIAGLDRDTQYEIQVWDLVGRMVCSSNMTTLQNVMQWPSDISSGSYVVRVISESLIEDHLHVVIRQ